MVGRGPIDEAFRIVLFCCISEIMAEIVLDHSPRSYCQDTYYRGEKHKNLSQRQAKIYCRHASQWRLVSVGTRDVSKLVRNSKSALGAMVASNCWPATRKVAHSNICAPMWPLAPSSGPGVSASFRRSHAATQLHSRCLRYVNESSRRLWRSSEPYTLAEMAERVPEPAKSEPQPSRPNSK